MVCKSLKVRHCNEHAPIMKRAVTDGACHPGWPFWRGLMHGVAPPFNSIVVSPIDVLHHFLKVGGELVQYLLHIPCHVLPLQMGPGIQRGG